LKEDTLIATLPAEGIGVFDAFLSLFVRFLSSTLIMNLLNDSADLNHPSNTPNGLFVEAIRHLKHTNRDQRRNVQILHREGFSIAQIAEKEGLTN